MTQSSSVASPRSRLGVWSEIGTLGERMLESARAADWSAALALLHQRNTLVVDFFDRPVSEAEAPDVAQAIQDTLEVDAELRRLSEVGRGELMSKLRNLRVGKMARHAYLSTPSRQR